MTRVQALAEIAAGRVVRVNGYLVYNEAELDHALDLPATAERETGDAAASDGLEALNLSDLQEIAAAEGIELAGGKKADAVAAIRAGRLAAADATPPTVAVSEASGDERA